MANLERIKRYHQGGNTAAVMRAITGAFRNVHPDDVENGNFSNDLIDVIGALYESAKADTKPLDLVIPEITDKSTLLVVDDEEEEGEGYVFNDEHLDSLQERVQKACGDDKDLLRVCNSLFHDMLYRATSNLTVPWYRSNDPGETAAARTILSVLKFGLHEESSDFLDVSDFVSRTYRDNFAGALITTALEKSKMPLVDPGLLYVCIDIFARTNAVQEADD